MTYATVANLRFTQDYVFYTVQGEGRYCGTPSIFIRLSGCNLRCQWQNPDGSITYCDTPYSSFQPENLRKTIAETIQCVQHYPARHVVITGGEPFLQPGVVTLIDRLVEQNYYVTVETNGTLNRWDRAQFLSISPKLTWSCLPDSPDYAVHQRQRLHISVLAQLVKRPHQLKFVVNQPDEIPEIEALITQLKTLTDYDDEGQIYLMPQGITVAQLDEKLPWLIEAAKSRNWRVSDRLHIRLWGDKRGT